MLKMNVRSASAFGLSLAVALIAGGCGKDGGSARHHAVPATSTAPAPAVKDALLGIADALDTGDKARFLNLVETADAEWAGLIFEAAVAGRAFRAYMEAAYGKQSLEQVDLPLPEFPGAEQLAGPLDVVAVGDSAVAVLPGPDELSMVRKDGRWLLDLTGDEPSEAEREAVLRSLRTTIRAVGEVRGKIGQAGLTPQKIDDELIAALMGAAATQPASRP
jgi:hypothetical protein